MLIAILVALGVQAGTILLILVGLVLFKRYKTVKHPAVFKVRVRLIEGQFPGLKSTWEKCYGAWVTTVFTTRKGIPLNIADVLPMESLDQLRSATPADEIKGLGDKPIVATFSMTTGAKLEVAMSADERLVGLKPWQAQAELLNVNALAALAPLPLATDAAGPTAR